MNKYFNFVFPNIFIPKKEIKYEMKYIIEQWNKEFALNPILTAYEKTIKCKQYIPWVKFVMILINNLKQSFCSLKGIK